MSTGEPYGGSGAPPPGPPAWGPPPEWGRPPDWGDAPSWGGAPGPPAGSPPGPPASGPPPEWGEGQPPPAAPAPPPPPIRQRFRQHFQEAPVTVSIVVVTVAVWLVSVALRHWAHINPDLTLGDNGKGIHGQWWRLLTPMVVHFSWYHIGLNMLVLWQIGPPVERTLGRWLYLASYIVCGVAGGVLSDIALKSAALSGGASGAIVGIVGVLIGNTVVTEELHAWGRRSTQLWRFNPKVARSLGIQIVLWIVISAKFIPGIDNWAHIGGGVAGLVIGAVVALVRSEPLTA